MDKTTVQFPSGTDAVIEADIYPAGPGADALVLCHGMVFSKDSWAGQVERFHAAGLLVLALNFRGYGKSTGSSASWDALAQDVLAAVRHLRTGHDVEAVHVLGGSMGGHAAAAAAALAAGDGEKINRLILLSPAGVDAPESLRADSVLYVVSEQEPMAAQVRDDYDRTLIPKELLLVPGNAHAQHIFPTRNGDMLVERIIAACTR